MERYNIEVFGTCMKSRTKPMSIDYALLEWWRPSGADTRRGHRCFSNSRNKSKSSRAPKIPLLTRYLTRIHICNGYDQLD